VENHISLIVSIQQNLFDTAEIDLREDTNTLDKLDKNKLKPISPEQGEKLAKELKAVKYVECSALTQVNLFLYFKQNFIVLFNNNSLLI
jgi:hypothetical protein